MARLQILELPEGASDERPPFVLVIDQADEQTVDDLREHDARAAEGTSVLQHLQRTLVMPLADQIGARAVLAFESTIDIPANQVTADTSGNLPPLRVRIEGDFEEFRQQVQEEATAAANTLAGARYAADQYSEQANRPNYGSGGYTIGGDVAPWHHGELKTAITDALGMDRLRDWDDIVNAARGLSKQRDDQRAALEAVAELHKRVEHRGQTICGHCSAWDGPEYDSTDNARIDWPCDTIKAATGYTGEPEAGEQA